MQVHAGITIAAAAQQLGIGSRTLFQLLRDHGVLSSNNIATRHYIVSGDFINQERSAFKQGTHIRRWYTVALVTGRGMSLLQEIVGGVAANGQVVVAEQVQPLPDQRSDVRPGDEVRRLGVHNGISNTMGRARHTSGR